MPRGPRSREAAAALHEMKGAVTPWSLMRDRTFRTSSFQNQDAELSKLDPEGFGRLTSPQKLQAIEYGLNRIEPESEMIDGFWKGNLQHAAGFAHRMANMLDTFPEDFQLAPPGRGGGRGYRGDVVPIPAGEAAQYMREASDRLSEEGALPEDATDAEKLASVVGTLPGSLVEAAAYMSGTAGLMRGIGMASRHIPRLAPGVAFGGMGVLDTRDQDWEAMVEAGAEGFFIGSLFPITQHMPKKMKALIIGGFTYGMTPDEMDPTLQVGHGLTMAILGSMSPRRPIDPLLAKTRIPILSKDYYRLRWAKEKMALEEKILADVEAEKLQRVADEQLREGERGQVTEPGELQTELPRLAPEKRALIEREITRLEELTNEKRLTLSEELDDALWEKGAESPRPKRRTQKQQTALKKEVKTLETKNREMKSRLKSGIEGRNFRDVERISVSERTPGAVVRGRDVMTRLAERLGIKGAGKEGGEFLVNDFIAADKTAAELGRAVGKEHELGREMGVEQMELSSEARTVIEKGEARDLPPWEKELRELSPDADSTAAGFSEFFRHYLTRTKKGLQKEGAGTKYEPGFSYLEEVAPEALARFEAAVETLPPAQQRALARARKEVSSWYEEGGLEAIRGVTSTGQHPILELLSMPDLMSEYMMDDLRGHWKLDEAAGRSPNEGTWQLASLTRGIPGAAKAALTQGHPTLIAHPNGGMMVRYQGKSIFQILDPIYRQGQKVVDNWNIYAQGRSAKELLGQTVGKEGIRPSTAHERANKLTREKLIDERMVRASERLETPEFHRAFNDLIEFNNRVLDFAEATGFLDHADRAQFKRAQYAFGMHRDMTTGQRGMAGTTDHLSSSLGFKKTHGSERLLLDNFHNLINGHARTISASLHNMKARQMVDMAMRDGAEGFLSRIQPKAEHLRISRENIKLAYERGASEMAKTDAAGGREIMDWIGNQPASLDRLSLFLGANKPHGSDIMTVMHGGKPEYYKIHDPMLQRSFEALQRPSQREVWKLANWAKTVKQSFIVLNPDFMVANFTRDALMSSIMTRTGNQNISSALNGLMNVTFNTQGYRDFVANMGGGATIRGSTAAAEAEMVRYSQLRRPKTTLIAGTKSVVPALRAIGNAMENAARVGEFIRAQRPHTARTKRKGFVREAGIDEAAFLGREISVDFARRGRGRMASTENMKGVLSFMNASVPFLSSMISSSNRLYRSVVTDPHAKVNTARKMAWVAGLSIGLQELNIKMAEKYAHLRDEDGNPAMDFNDLEPWELAGYWHFWIPHDFDPETGEPQQLWPGRIPKLWEVGLLGTVAEMVVRAGKQDGKFDSEFYKAITQTVAHNFNLNIVGDTVPFPLPAGADLIYEQMSEKILFTGQPMLSEKDKGFGPEEKFLQSGPNTPMALDALAYALRMAPDVPGISTLKSPKKAEAALRNITGRWSEYGIRAGEALFRGINETLSSIGWQMMDPELYASNDIETLDEAPGFRRFTRQRGRHSKAVTEYYDLMRETRQARNAWAELSARGETKLNEPRKQDFLDNPEKMAAWGVHPTLKRASEAIVINQKHRMGIKRGLLMQDNTPEERAKKLRELEAERNAMIKKVNDDVRKEKEAIIKQMEAMKREQQLQGAAGGG